MRLAIAVPEAHVSADVLNAGLEATTRLNENLIKDREVPLFRDAVERVRWKPEPPGDECFDHAKVVLGRGWGDCDDLATWHAASLRETGEDARAKAIVKKSGPNRWHAVVQRGDGSIDDPSREAGMGRTNGILGAKLPLMMHAKGRSGVNGTFVAMPQLAMRPVRNGRGQVEAWQARADLPWHWDAGRSPGDVAMASLHASPISDQSIAGACDGLISLGEANDVDEEILDRAAAVRDMCDGYGWDDIADEYGDEHATAAGHLIHGFFMGPRVSGAGYVAPINRFPGDAAHLGEVFWRFARGEQPRERGGKHYSLKELQYAQTNENAYRATLDPAARAQRVAMFAREGGQAHQARRSARQFGNVLKSGFASALPIAQGILPMIPGFGTLASAALNLASPALQQLLQSGEHLPPPGMGFPMPPGLPQGFQMPQNFGQAAQYATQVPGFISAFG